MHAAPVAAEECHQHTETEEDHDVHVAEIAVLPAIVIGKMHLNASWRRPFAMLLLALQRKPAGCSMDHAICVRQTLKTRSATVCSKKCIPCQKSALESES